MRKHCLIVTILPLLTYCRFQVSWCHPMNATVTPTTGLPTKFISVDDLVNQIIQNQSNFTMLNLTSTADHKGHGDQDQPSKELYRANLFSSFPSDFMSSHYRRNGGFMVHIFIFLYLCLVLTLAIDYYFIPSLQMFSITYHLSPNITGSTLMVLGTSLPELFTSIINVFLGESLIGTGAIVVSSIFNVLAIPGICGLAVLSLTRFSSMQLNSWPIRREIIFYSITIIVFLLAIKDDSIDWMESLVFIFIYTVYMFCLYLWSHFEITQRSIKRKFLRSKDRQLKYTHYLQQSKINMQPSKHEDYGFKSDNKEFYNGSVADNFIMKYTLMPFRLLFMITIPKSSKKTFIGTYILSSIWIVAITYLLIWMVSIIFETFHLTHSGSVMTMLALGNITKLISSVIVVKKLHLPDMAICHTIGSNIFNILICLGLPWLLKIFILTVKEGSTLEKLQEYTIRLDDCLFEYVAISLTVLLITFIMIFYLSDWKLTIVSSISCVLFYWAFLICLIVVDQYISIA